MRINTNVSSLTAQEAATNTSARITSSLEKLSTGLRINKASDDASGLAIADKLRTQATSINQGISNGNSAVSLLQIADKSMAEQSNILDTIKSKLIQANTDTTSADGRESIRKDITKLLEQLNGIAKQTNYNGITLLQASSTSSDKSTALSFQIGESNQNIISNTSIQSNTEGLGSKTNYYNQTTLKSGNSILVTSDSSIKIVGGDKAGNTTTENVTLSGSVSEITLRNGATISNTDSATKDILKNTTGISYDSIKDVFTVTSSTPLTVNLSSVGNVSATVTTPNSDYLKPTDVSVGQIVTVSTGSLVSGSELDLKLHDSNLFTQMASSSTSTPIFVAIANTTINSLATSGSTTESFKLMTTTNVETGNTNTTFNAGDTIKATSVSGSLLQTALKDTNMFKANADGTYTVKQGYTAGSLRLMDGESIKITQGEAATIGGLTTGATTTGVYAGTSNSDGLLITSINYNAGGDVSLATAAYQVSGDFGSLQLLTGAPTPSNTLYGSGEDTISFNISASGASMDSATLSFAYKAGDIVTLTKDSITGGLANDDLSKELMSTTNFVALSGGKYQALTAGGLSMDNGDKISVTRLIGSNAEPKEIKYDSTNTESKSITTNDNSISLKTAAAITITNNDTTKGNDLTFTSDSNMTNGKESLASLAELGSGELSSSLASSFQTVVDDAITKLNNYRGDVGSTQNQVESAVRNLMTQATNVKAAESIIRDVDYAAESANFNKQNIISQAGSYAISQSNSIQQNVLRLLQ